jgi:replicative DNA helicase
MATDDPLRRMPPQNIEAEQAVLGAVLLSDQAINLYRIVPM